ncbi:MAG: DEAD/DEAH box helicase family protein [Nitrososphaera sp.]
MEEPLYKPQEERIPPKGNISEADTRASLIDPLLYKSGWTNDLISREYPISVGRIEIIGDTHKRAKPKRADYILRLNPDGEIIAVIEAKVEYKSSIEGIMQAKDYALKLGAPFAYSTNGKDIEEFDFTTNRQQTISSFPTPGDLKNRFLDKVYTKTFDKNQLQKILSSEYYKIPKFELRAYQEGAVSSAIRAILNGQKRILLTLATGTGKTVIAFGIVWRLVKSGYFKRVLFIADRNFLRNQAYNTFSPFDEARVFIEEGKAPKHRTVYFSIYQALYSQLPNGKRIYEEYPKDFFDLVIIDECHRSGFGTWHEILRYFSSAVHLGMTATPKRSDNIDTYEYFGEPVYIYSYGQGVQDGYLAPFIIHKVLTNIDKEGKLEIKEAKSKGAEIILPVAEEPQDVYTQKEFERKITLPDRTREIAKHLAKFLKNFDPMSKTMVFCVDSDHADLMAKELQNEFSDFGIPNFAVSIIARNGDIVESEYEKFRDSEKPVPVIATTVDLLTTGVDVPSVRNIVLVKPINSKIVFKQIIGRGSRIDEITDKHFFRIIDYVGATRLFDDWEKIPDITTEEQTGNPIYFISGIVVDSTNQEPIPNATIILQKKPNEQISQQTNKKGEFTFKELPQKKFHISIRATGYQSRTISLNSNENPKEFVVIELKPEIKTHKQKVLVKGLPVYIAEEEKMFLEKEGKTIEVKEYIKYAGKEIVEKTAHIEDFKKIWINPESRKKFLGELYQKSIYPEVIAELLDKPDIDTFDLLAHIAFGKILLTRDERAEAFLNLEQKFISAFPESCKEILFALIERYRLAGIEEIENPKVFDLNPFDKMGKIEGISKALGGIDKLKETINLIRNKIYQYDQ